MESLRGDDPRRIGPYRLTMRLGSGGMGTVFLGVADDDQRVAIKLLHAQLAHDPEFRARFARELDAARKVTGPYTARVLDASPDANPPWLATTCIPGPTLHAYVREHGPLPAAEVAALGERLAEGLADIHGHGLIHRDLKPANVIMAEGGPRIIDFGLAKAVDASTLTPSGAVIGTYAYMAPERITADEAGPASDVFSWACVLAFAATGTGPFDASTVPAIIHRILSGAPKLDGLSGRPREVIEACLVKDPEQRPGLDEVLRRLRSEDAPADPPVTTAPSAGPVAPSTRWTSIPRPGRRTVLFGGLVVLAGAAVPFAARYWSDRNMSMLTGKPIHGVAFSPDGKTVAGCDRNGGGRLWNAATGEQIAAFSSGTGGGGAVAFSPDGKTLVTSGAPLSFRNPETGAVTGRLDARVGDVAALAFNRDGSRLVVGGRSGGSYPDVCTVVSVPDGRFVRYHPFPSPGRARVDSLAFMGATDVVLIGGTTLPEDHGYWFWNAKSGLFPYLAATPEADVVAATRDGGRFAVGGPNGSALSRTHARPGVATLSTAPVDALAFSPDGSTLAVADTSGIRLWDVRTGRRTATVTDLRAASIAFSPDGSTLAAGSPYAGGTGCRLWPVDHGR